MTKVALRIFCTSLLISFWACTWDQLEPKIDCSAFPIVVTLLESEDTGCGSANGSFSVSAEGGIPPYVFTSATLSNADGIFQDIVAGNYTVVATDANGCTGQIDVEIANQDGVNITEVSASKAGCGTSEGSIQVDASGGAAPYQFMINGAQAQASNEFTNLDHGSYTVTVVDQLGCEVSQTVKISSGVSYSTSIRTILQNSCAVSGCHSGSVSPDLRSFDNIQAFASAIKSRTGNRSMPKGSSLSQEEIDKIACWVDDGALEN